MPKPFANGVCVHSLAKESVKRGEETHVICTGDWRGRKVELVEGITVHKLKTPFYNFFLDYYANHKTSLLGKVAFRIGRGVALCKKLMHVKEYPLRDQCLVRRYVDECKKTVKGKKDVVVVASYTPFEGIKAGAIIKGMFPYVHTVYYSLDTLSNESGFGVLPESVRAKIGLNQELKYFSKYDKLLLMNCHKKHYEAEEFSQYTSKIVWADFPLFQPQDNTISQHSLKIVYTGSLYRGIRNPRSAMELLSSVLDTYSVHFYGQSDCDDILEEYATKFPGHVVCHGLVSHKEAIKAAAEADILLSLGNAHTEMAPSKIYEQMSTGKPIIHTYAEQNDPCLPLLKEYGNALCVDIANISSVNIKEFVDQLAILSKGDLDDKFIEASPKYTLDLIMRHNENS